MVENYIAEEAIELCSEFMTGVSSVGLNSFVIKAYSNVDRALSASSFIRPSKEQLDQAHLYIIQNINDVLPHVEYVLPYIFSYYISWLFNYLITLSFMTDNIWRVCVSLTLVNLKQKNKFKKSIIAHSVGGCSHG